MKTISAIVVAKNEEKMIRECLASLSFCDEIIVIDNGSEDATLEISKKMDAKIFEYKSADKDFSDLRNFGASKTTTDWILYVDADERVSLRLKEEIKSKILKDSSFDAYKVKRKNFYLGNYEWPYIEKLERLFKKDRLKSWQGKLHESPIVEGKVGELEGFLLHYTHRDLASMVNKTIEWSKTEAQLRLSINHPKMTWWRFPRVMITAFLNSYIRQGGYKVGMVGLIESVYQSFSMFITYARLWELQNEKIKNTK